MLNKWRKDRVSKLHGLCLLHRKAAGDVDGQSVNIPILTYTSMERRKKVSDAD